MIFNTDGTVGYTLTRSKRAKHVRLKVTRTKGLEVVVPESFKMEWLPSILEKRTEWIRKAAKRLDLPETGQELPPLIPEQILLPSIDSEYAVQFASNLIITEQLVDADKIIRTSTGLLSVETQGTVLLPNNVPEEDQIDLLNGWLIRCGKEYLPELLEDVSAEVGIPFKKVQVRLQKGRWGSCSSRGTISLNARLLLLPSELLRYILLHELAHVRHPNHSNAYWCFLQTLDEKALEYDVAMRDAWKYIPRCFSM